MVSSSDLTGLVALEPPGPGRVHLHLPGYQPGRKARTQENAPLCGVFVLRGLNQVSPDIARDWPYTRASWGGPSGMGDRYWCPMCLGRLATLLGLQDHLISQALLAIEKASNPA